MKEIRTLMDGNQLATHLGVCKRTVERLRNSGTIKGVRIGARLIKYDLAQVERDLEIEVAT
jgi:hypothetical protein